MRELGALIPFVEKRINTPNILETVGQSLSVIGSLVCSKTTVIANISLCFCSYLSKLFITLKCDSISKVTRKTSYKINLEFFLQLQIHSKFCLPILFYYCESVVVKSHSRILYKQTVYTNTNEFYSIGSLHLALLKRCCNSLHNKKTPLVENLLIGSFNI